jgi:ABC-type antimicrobial peptide transport system permease subunit
MLATYFVRSWKELLRFRGRNIVSFIGVTVMIVSLTALLSVLIQMNNIYKQSDSDLIQKLQIVNIPGQGLGTSKLQELAAMEGVAQILPLSNPISYPWVNVLMGEQPVLPVYFSYYDPEYSSFFQNKKVMKYISEGQPDAIVGADFKLNILGLAQYREAFGLEKPVSLEMMGAAATKLIKQYQTLSLASENSEEADVVGQALSFSNEHKYFAGQGGNVPSQSTATITGQLKPDMLNIPGNRILLPATSSSFFSEFKERKFYDIVYIKAESADALPIVMKQLKAKGYSVYDLFEMNKHNTTASSQFLRKISIIMLVILLIAILNFINTLHSSIEERRKEIALKKAIGASNTQIILGYVLEGIVLVSAALVVSFILVGTGFYVLRRMVHTGIIHSSYYEALYLNRSAMEQIFKVPPLACVSVSVGLYVLCLLASVLPVWSLVNKSYMSLMKRG